MSDENSPLFLGSPDQDKCDACAYAKEESEDPVYVRCLLSKIVVTSPSQADQDRWSKLKLSSSKQIRKCVLHKGDDAIFLPWANMTTQIQLSGTKYETLTEEQQKVYDRAKDEIGKLSEERGLSAALNALTNSLNKEVL